MAIVRPYISAILYANKLDSSIEFQSAWMDLKKKKKSNSRLPTKTHFSFNDTTAWKGRVKNGSCVQMKTKSKLYLDKTDFQTKTIIRNTVHYIITKGSIQQEDITFVNIHAPNVGAQK